MQSASESTRKLPAPVAKGLFPGYFAFTMATGIVATAADLSGVPALGYAMFAIASVGYVWLLSLTVWRAIFYWQDLLGDFRNFARGPGFFTMVAATSVLAAASIRLFRWHDLALGLWIFGLAIWTVFIYGFALSAITSEDKPPVERAVNGSWLIIVVATQSLSIVGSLLSTWHKAPWIYPLATAFFMLGCGLYLLLISVVTMRLLFRPVQAPLLTPLYWILMGSAAISTLAGVELDRHASAWPFQINAQPVLQGFTLFFWIAATGWIPLLVLLGVWRHAVKRHSFEYEPQLWSVVFPLGMYSVATYSLSSNFKLSFLIPIAQVFMVLAMFVWLLTFSGLTVTTLRSVRSRRN